MRSRYVSRMLFILVSLGALITFGIVEGKAQGPDVNYSKFLHTSQRHASLGCNSCHQRADNSPTPRFPGQAHARPAISTVHHTSDSSLICHTETSGTNLRSEFSAGFRSFNVKFDRFQHMKDREPQAGCNGCYADW